MGVNSLPKTVTSYISHCTNRKLHPFREYHMQQLSAYKVTWRKGLSAI